MSDEETVSTKLDPRNPLVQVILDDMLEATKNDTAQESGQAISDALMAMSIYMKLFGIPVEGIEENFKIAEKNAGIAADYLIQNHASPEE